MATKALTITYGADTKGVKAALDDIDKHHANTTGKFAGLSSSFGLLKGSLGELAGGLGPLTEAAAKASEGLAHIKEKFAELDGVSKKAGAALVGTGAAMTGLGAVGVALGEKQEQATKSLEVAIKNTDSTYEEHAKAIDKAVKLGEQHSHSAADTKEAISKLTIAFGDASKATADMSLVNEIAAKKHISLTDAADQALKIHQGASKVLKQYGIDATAAGAGSKELAAAHKADEAAMKAMLPTQESTAAMEEKLATKYGMTKATALAVAAAHKAVDEARKSGDISKVIDAEGQLGSVLYKATNGLKMSATDTDALSKARYNLQDKSSILEAADTRLAKAQDGAKNSTSGLSFEQQVLGRIHGTAAAQADTFGGKIAAVKTHLIDAAGAIGAKFGPALSMAGPAMMGLGAIMESGLVPKMLALGAQAVTTAAWWVSSQLSMMAASITAATGINISTGGLLLILGALIAAVLLVWKNWDAIWKFIKNLVSEAVDWIHHHLLLLIIAGGPIGLLIAAIDFLAHHWEEIWGAIKQVAAEVWRFLQPIFNAIVNEGLHFVETWLGRFSAAWRNIWEAISPILGFIGRAIKTAIVDEITTAKIVWDVAWGAIKAVALDVWHFVEPVFHWIVEKGIWLVKGEIQLLSDIWGTIWHGIQAVVEAVWRVIQPIIGGIKEGIGAVTGALKGVGGVVGGAAHLLGFAGGGTIPGAVGSPQIVLAHGGEEITPIGYTGNRGGDGGNVYVTVQVAGSVTSERNLTNTIYEGLLEVKRRQGTLGLA